MDIVVIGANGRTGRLVVGRAVAAGHRVTGMVRRAEQMDAQRDLGAEAVIGDVTADLAPILTGCEAVVFAAGGGAGADWEAVDHAGVLGAVRTAEAVGARRFVLVSSRYADRPAEGPEFLRPALEAKGRSDAFLAASGLEWTIVRPGGLTDGPPTGLIETSSSTGPGRIARADVADVVVTALGLPSTIRRAFDVVGGEVPIPAALAAL